MITPFQESGTSVANKDMAAPAAGQPWAGSIVAIVWLGLLVMASAQAIDIPALPVVPPNVAATHPALVQERETLISERKALLDKTNKHNSMCNAVEAGSAADSICTRAYAPLDAEIKSHVQVSKKYVAGLLVAVNLVASQAAMAAPAPHTDTSVVDARNVPSGLPKALDNAIANAYASAPPGVSDRVRKGFQAVMARDWKVAKAWFQDALNRDPNNAGLKRMVALAGSPQQHALSRVEVDARNEPAGPGGGSPLKGSGATPGKTKTATASKNPARIPLQLPNPNDIQVMFPGVKSVDDKLALDALFGLNAQPTASKSVKTR